MNLTIPSLTTANPERTLEYEFVRATENAALNVLQWLVSGEKEFADAAACDAMNGVFDRVDSRGETVTGESAAFCATGISDSALLPGMKSRAGRFQKTQNACLWPLRLRFVARHT